MKIASSARKHDIDPADIRHAVRHAIRIVPDDDDPDRVLYLGPDRAARLLEVVVLDGDDVAIHAMPIRPKFLDYL